MPFRRIAAVLSIAILFLAATPKKKKPAPAPPAPRVLAPDSVPHAQAMFLAGLCKDGKERLSFKAAAYGKHFFIEEPSGVTVYAYDGSGYRKETFLAKMTLEKAMKKYPDEMKK
ncbi:MAG TPA: hypothetical protein VN605_02660 [Thermoanaerobaculia bacterium]|nr:hypothetical protein [Thermoanaerobaculia bacterium]